LTPGVYRMTAQIREKIPPQKTCPRFYLSERRHEIWPGKNVHLDCLLAKTLIPVYFTYFPFPLLPDPSLGGRVEDDISYGVEY
jgi:hypothetical protein